MKIILDKLEPYNLLIKRVYEGVCIRCGKNSYGRVIRLRKHWKLKDAKKQNNLPLLNLTKTLYKKFPTGIYICLCEHCYLEGYQETIYIEEDNGNTQMKEAIFQIIINNSFKKT